MSGPIACRTSHDLPATPWSCSVVNFPAPGISRSITNFGITLLLMKATIVVKTRAMIKRALVFFFAAAASAATPDVSILKNLQWREVGPYRGGRADAVEGIASQPDVYYFGSTGGGVWKTTDGGQTWKPVSDGFFGGTVGAIAVAPSDPAIIYVGTGEETIRGNVSPGAGMWKSTDAGKTWTHIGLDDSQHIGRIRCTAMIAE